MKYLDKSQHLIVYIYFFLLPLNFLYAKYIKNNDDYWENKYEKIFEFRSFSNFICIRGYICLKCFCRNNKQYTESI